MRPCGSEKYLLKSLAPFRDLRYRRASPRNSQIQDLSSATPPLLIDEVVERAIFVPPCWRLCVIDGDRLAAAVLDIIESYFWKRKIWRQSKRILHESKLESHSMLMFPGIACPIEHPLVGWQRQRILTTTHVAEIISWEVLSLQWK